MPEYNPAYKEQRKQVKYKENRSVKKVYKTSEKSIDKEKEMLYFFCINKNGAMLRNAERKKNTVRTNRMIETNGSSKIKI